jgi:hypothetical protein
MIEPLVMVMNRNREDALGALLADHIIVEDLADLDRRRNAAFPLRGDGPFGLFANDIIAELDAFVADEHGGPGDELANFVLRLAAE